MSVETEGPMRSAPDSTGVVEAAPVAPRVIRRRHPWRWASAVVLLGLVVGLSAAALRSPEIDYSVVPAYLFSPVILSGVRATLVLTLLAEGIGILLGILLAVMRLSTNPVMATFSRLYIWVFRGTPPLIQLILWFNLALVFPTISISIPFLGTHLVHESTNALISPFSAAIIGLSLMEASYMAEIVRSGILSVDEGQVEAAKSIGMTSGMTMRRIVLPQAIRVIIPPTGNELISMLKNTSLVSVIGYAELLSRARTIYAQNLHVVELLLVASIWYLVLTTALGLIQSRLERRFARGAVRHLQPRGRRPSLAAAWRWPNRMP